MACNQVLVNMVHGVCWAQIFSIIVLWLVDPTELQNEHHPAQILLNKFCWSAQFHFRLHFCRICWVISDCICPMFYWNGNLSETAPIIVNHLLGLIMLSTMQSDSSDFQDLDNLKTRSMIFLLNILNKTALSPNICRKNLFPRGINPYFKWMCFIILAKIMSFYEKVTLEELMWDMNIFINTAAGKHCI